MQRRYPKELNFEGLEMQKQNIPTDIAQRVDEKNGTIYQFILFNPELWSLKFKNGSYSVLLMTAIWVDGSHNLGKLFRCIWNVLFNFYRKCYGLLGSKLPFARCQQLKIQEFVNFCWLTDSSTNGKTIPFPKELNKISQAHLNMLLKLWLIFCCHQQKMQKISHFWRCNDHNSGGSKHDKCTNDPVFLIHSELYPLVYFIPALQELQNSIPCTTVCKIRINMLKMTLLSLLTYISFFYRKFANCWYIWRDQINYWSTDPTDPILSKSKKIILQKSSQLAFS